MRVLVQGGLVVTVPGDRSGFTSMCRFRGRRSAADMVVVSDFVTGAVQ